MNFFQINRYTITLLLLNCVGIIATLIYNDTVITDMWEHLRATYLVSLGNVPYKDFFEHHHPLLWYVFLPVMYLFPKDAVLIYYVARITALFCFAGTLFCIYLITKRFLGGKNTFLTFLLILGTFFPVWYVVSAFKPEAFAYLIYFIGVYYCFDYIKNKRSADLLYCGIFFSIAFLFIQTMIFNVAFIYMVLVVLYYKNKKFWQYIFLSAIIPFIVFIIIAYLLYQADMLNTYFQLNWIYNTKIDIQTPLTIWNWSLQLFAAGCVFAYLKPKSVYLNIIAFLLCGEILLVFCFHKSFPHYLFLMFIYSSLLLAVYLQTVRSKVIQHYVLGFMCACLVLNFLTVFLKNNQNKMEEYKIVNQSPKVTVLNINSQLINIYGEKYSYYELFATGLVSLDICEFKRFSDYDLKQNIIEYQYDYLAYNANKNIRSFCNAEKFTPTPDVLKYYEIVTENLWKRKQP